MDALDQLRQLKLPFAELLGIEFVAADKEPVVLKVGDKLTLKCVYIPPGKYLMGTPVYFDCGRYSC